MMHLAASLAVVALLALVVATTITLSRAIAKLAAFDVRTSPRELPALLVIRPVRGLDTDLEANIAAALSQTYPGPMETLFVVDDEGEPALPVIRRVIAARRADARIVLAGALRADRTGKLHAMICGLDAARIDAELVCFADSDTRPGPTLLWDLAAVVVSRPTIGAAFARAVCVEPAQTAWDVCHSVMLDALYGPQAGWRMVARRSLPFIMGQTVVLRRSALNRTGGLEGSQGQLVDDMHIGQRLASTGYENVLCSHAIPVAQTGLSWPMFRAQALRWITYGRTGIPFWPFNAPTIVLTLAFLVGVAGALFSAARGASTLLALCLACALAAVLSVEILRRRHGGGRAPARFFWAAPALLALLPFFFVRALRLKRVEWRGRSYSLDESGSLATSSVSVP